jgi:hypothetical protein
MSGRGFFVLLSDDQCNSSEHVCIFCLSFIAASEDLRTFCGKALSWETEMH